MIRKFDNRARRAGVPPTDIIIWSETSLWARLSVDLLVGQSVGESVSRSVGRSFGQSVNRSVGKSVGNLSMFLSYHLLVYLWFHNLLNVKP